jgi:hypothetical protein
MSIFAGFKGDYAPRTVSMRVTDDVIDFGDVTAATFSVRKPDGTEVTWTPVRTVGDGYIDLVYTLVASPGTSDFDQAGEYRIYATLTTPDGPIRCDTQRFYVRDEYEVP